MKIKAWIGIILAVATVGGYAVWQKYKNAGAAVRYVASPAQKGTLIASVNGSGQVSVSNQVDLKPKASGNIVRVNVVDGQRVRAGALVAQIDSLAAEQAVRNAELDIESAKVALNKLQEPADQLSTVQSENALADANVTKQDAQAALAKAYNDGFNSVASAFLDAPSVITGTHDVLYSYNLDNNQENMDYYVNAVQSYDAKISQLRDTAAAQYQAAKKKYDQNFSDYKLLNRSSATSSIESLIAETYDTAQAIDEATKDATSLIQFYEDTLSSHNISSKPVSLAGTQIASLNTYTGQMNSHLTDLLAIENTIQTSKDAINTADRTIVEKNASLAKLKAGADPLDIQAQELVVKQKQNALVDAQLQLADYFVRAPFDGIVAKVLSKVGDPVSSGVSVATFITKEQLAEISLNEVDAAKAAVGQKATLTFDAVPNLSIAGTVMEIDTIGTVTQGVVTYMVKIGFATQDARVKSGMSVNAAIITNVKQDVLIAPNAAIKGGGGGPSYVEVLDSGLSSPRRAAVETGTSNDTETEIVSGIKEGDAVVTQTITSAPASPQAQGGGLRIPGLTGGGGGVFRGAGGLGR